MPVVIAPRFNGPPGSGHGGYSAGCAAVLVDGAGRGGDAAAAAAAGRGARASRATDGGAALLDGDERRGVRAAGGRSSVDGPPPVGLDAAAAASGALRVGARPPVPDLLRLRAASAIPPTRSASSPGRSATGASRCRGRRRRGPATASSTRVFAWAALDCPSSAPVHGTISAPVVLGRLTVALEGPIEVGAPHVIQSWLERQRRPQAPHRRRAVHRGRRAAGGRAARCGSSWRSRWARERGGARGRRRDRARWRCELVAAMIAEVGEMYEPGPPAGPSARRRSCRRPHGGFVVLQRGRPRGRGRRRASGSTTARCEIKRMYVVPGGARPRRRARRCSRRSRRWRRDLGYAVARLDTGAEQPARAADVRARRLRRRCRTTTATRTRRSGARSARGGQP